MPLVGSPVLPPCPALFFQTDFWHAIAVVGRPLRERGAMKKKSDRKATLPICAQNAAVHPRASCASVQCLHAR